jgi:hypothetical protein
MLTISPLCQLNGGCMGCCGNNFVSVKKIEEAIRKNTLDFVAMSPKEKEEFQCFRNRANSSQLRHGVCMNLISRKGKNFCPLHPACHDGQDLREGHCDINFLCKSAKEFAKCDSSKQNEFIDFIKSKKLSSIEFSVRMDNGQLWKDFLMSSD